MMRVFLILYLAVLMLVAGFVQVLGPLWVESISSAHSSRAADLLTLQFLFQVPFFLGLAGLQSRLGFFKLFSLSIALMTLCWSILAFTRNAWFFDAAWISMYVMESAFVILGTNLLQANIAPQRRAFYSGLMMAVMGIGNFLAPFLQSYFSPYVLSLNVFLTSAVLLILAFTFLRLGCPQLLANASSQDMPTLSLKTTLKMQLTLCRHPILILYVMAWEVNGSLYAFLLTGGKQDHWTKVHDLYANDLSMLYFIFLVPMGMLADKIGIYRSTMGLTIGLAFLSAIGLWISPTWFDIGGVFLLMIVLSASAQTLLYAYLPQIFTRTQLLGALAATQVLAALVSAFCDYALGKIIAQTSFRMAQYIMLAVNGFCFLTFFLIRKRYDHGICPLQPTIKDAAA